LKYFHLRRSSSEWEGDFCGQTFSRISFDAMNLFQDRVIHIVQPMESTQVY